MTVRIYKDTVAPPTATLEMDSNRSNASDDGNSNEFSEESKTISIMMVDQFSKFRNDVNVYRLQNPRSVVSSGQYLMTKNRKNIPTLNLDEMRNMKAIEYDEYVSRETISSLHRRFDTLMENPILMKRLSKVTTNERLKNMLAAALRKHFKLLNALYLTYSYAAASGVPAIMTLVAWESFFNHFALKSV